MKRAGAALAVLAAAMVLISSPMSAQAHNYLVSSTPAAGSTLTALPPAFIVTTDEPLLTAGGATSGFAFEIKDAAGAYYGDGCLSVTGASMSTTPELGAPGSYSALWQVVSADGHTVSGEIPFDWRPASAEAAAPGSATPPDCNGTRPVADGTGQPTADRRDARADLSDVLWVGGAGAAVLIAAVVTFLIVTRRPRPDGDSSE